MNFVADLLWPFRSFYLLYAALPVGSSVEWDFFCLETWTVKLFNENDVHVYWESYDHYILVTIKDLFFWQRVVYL
jgi:hypothetical protein